VESECGCCEAMGVRRCGVMVGIVMLRRALGGGERFGAGIRNVQG
jgi:hypothetical protein